MYNTHLKSLFGTRKDGNNWRFSFLGPALPHDNSKICDVDPSLNPILNLIIKVFFGLIL